MWPICAQCQRQIEHIEIDRDVRSEQYVFRIFCHGAMEEHIVNAEFFQHPGKIGTATVFDTKALPAATPALPEAKGRP